MVVLRSTFLFDWGFTTGFAKVTRGQFPFALWFCYGTLEFDLSCRLCQTEIDQIEFLSDEVEQKVRRFDVSVNDSQTVNVFQSGQKALHVNDHL